MDWTTNDIINMMLKQLGSTSVKTVHANITVAKFEIEDYKMSYMYEAREDGSIYLSRVSPYPLLLGRFFGEQDVIDYIRNDLEKFRRAQNSHKFEDYLAFVNEITKASRQLEQLFLNNHVDAESLKNLLDDIDKVKSDLVEAEKSSTRLDE